MTCPGCDAGLPLDGETGRHIFRGEPWMTCGKPLSALLEEEFDRDEAAWVAPCFGCLEGLRRDELGNHRWPDGGAGGYCVAHLEGGRPTLVGKIRHRARRFLRKRLSGS